MNALKGLICLFKGHRYIYLGRRYLDKSKKGALFTLHYGCLRCNHKRHEGEIEP